MNLVSKNKKKRFIQSAKFSGISVFLFIGLLFSTGMVSMNSVELDLVQRTNLAHQLGVDESDVSALIEAVRDERLDHWVGRDNY